MYEESMHSLNSLLEKHRQPDNKIRDTLLELNSEIHLLKESLSTSQEAAGNLKKTNEGL
jgi:hypothetical protein